MKTKMKNPQKTQKPIKLSKGLNPKTQKPLLLPTLAIMLLLNVYYAAINLSCYYAAIMLILCCY